MVREWDQETFETVLRANGCRVTTQRLAIRRALHDLGTHHTAEEVLERVKPALPRLSLTTVYKVLNELVDLGLARRVVLGDGSTRYDADASPHAHLYCTVCGHTEDVPPTDYHVGLPPALAHGYGIVDQSVIFFGRCPLCRTVADLAPPNTTNSN